MPEVGQNVQLNYGTTGNTLIGEVQSVSVSIDSNQIDVNSFDVGAINKYIKGRSDVTLTITCLYTRGQDSAHAQLIADSITPNAGRKQLIFGPKNSQLGDRAFVTQGRPSSVEISADDDEAQTISFDFQVSEQFNVSIDI